MRATMLEAIPLPYALLPACLVVGALAGAAKAADHAGLADTCFATRYNAEYLTAHPGQRVASISANFQEFDNNLLTSVIYKLRFGTTFGFSGACYTKVPGGFLCEACVNENCGTSGGQFVVRWAGGDTLTIANDLTGLLAKNAAGGRDYLSAGGADGEFVLRRASAERCRG
jgi:hypothetical protein